MQAIHQFYFLRVLRPELKKEEIKKKYINDMAEAEEKSNTCITYERWWRWWRKKSCKMQLGRLSQCTMAVMVMVMLLQKDENDASP